MIQYILVYKNPYFILYFVLYVKGFSMNKHLKCKKIFSSRFSELMKECFPLKNKHKEEKQDKRTARENFELLQQLDIDLARVCLKTHSYCTI